MSATTFTCPACGAVSHNPNDVEHNYCGRCHTFWRQLGPGVYSNDRGEIHMFMPDTLADLGVADTPENRAVLESEVRRAFGMSDVEVVE